MKQPQLIPKHRRKRQPTADTMREQLRLAADEIIRLRMLNADLMRAMDGATLATWKVEMPRLRPTWLQRLWNRLRARVVETDPETAAKMPPEGQ